MQPVSIRNLDRRVWACLALAAVLFKSVFALGYMPEFDRSGAIEITMCSAGEHKSVVFQPTDDTPAQHGSKDACAFAVAGVSIVPAGPSIDAASSIYSYELAFAAHASETNAASWAKHAPPTGPPVLT
jgi:hypothetical protein